MNWPTFDLFFIYYKHLTFAIKMCKGMYSEGILMNNSKLLESSKKKYS